MLPVSTLLSAVADHGKDSALRAESHSDTRLAVKKGGLTALKEKDHCLTDAVDPLKLRSA